jgi:hypothetical protein
MKTSLIIFLASILASSFLFAEKIVRTSNPVAKVIVADEIIDKNDTAAQKVIKGKAVQGDHRKKRRIEREINH